MNYKTAVTETLLRACINKDKKAQMELYERFYAPLYRAAFGILKNRDDALDAMQEGFITAFEKLDQFENKGSFEGWLHKIVIRKSIAHFHQKKRYVLTETLEERGVQANSNEELEEKKEEPLNNVQLDKVLKQMKENYRLVLQLFYIEGFSHQEISEIMQWSISKSRTLLSRAKVQLKKQLS